MVLVLHLIGWESDMSFLQQPQYIHGSWVKPLQSGLFSTLKVKIFVLTVTNNTEDTITTGVRMTTRNEPSLVRIFLFLNENSSVKQWCDELITELRVTRDTVVTSQNSKHKVIVKKRYLMSPGTQPALMVCIVQHWLRSILRRYQRGVPRIPANVSPRCVKLWMLQGWKAIIKKIYGNVLQCP